ncbi:MAG TPA: hypothetical protein PKA06_02115 [Gemmatales bacterium]|nr:hypothetical protein [Gemmatales bacterium]
MSYYQHHETESPARLNRVLAQARRAELQRRQQLTTKELLATTRLELGLIGPRVLSQYLGRDHRTSQ